MNLFKPFKISATLLIGVLFCPGLIYADTEELSGVPTITRQIDVDLGYQGFSLNDSANRAAEYRSLRSSATFGLNLFNDSLGKHFHLDALFLNEDEFHANMDYSHENLVRVQLNNERFVHNLDHIPYDNGFSGGESYTTPFTRTMTGPAVEGSRPDGAYTDDGGTSRLRTYYTDQNPAADYRLRLDVNEAKVKIKYPSYPAHINLAYWRFEKKGHQQLRFVGETCTTACHMQSKTRNVDRVTEEFTLGADAHVGFFDFALEALFRQFRDKQAIEKDEFGPHERFPGGSGRDLSQNPFEHSEDPDSELREITFTANTAPSGGLVGSASFTIGERENKSDLTSVGPVDAETDYYKTAADLTYTPGENWTLNLRYRFLDMDSSNTNQFISYGSTNLNPLDVREAMDLDSTWYEVILNYRPSRRLTLKGELRREEIGRSNTGPGGDHSSPAIIQEPVEINPQWQLPDEEVIHRAKIGFHSRLLDKSALKLSGWLSLQHSDEPSYGTSFKDRQQLFVSSNYNPSPFWGILANVNVLQEDNDEHMLHDVQLERDREQQSMALSGYATSGEGLSFNLNYSYMRTEVDQDLLYGSGTQFVPALGSLVDYAIPDYASSYNQSVHTLSAGVTWQAREDLLCYVEGYHIRSKSRFSPEFDTMGPYPYNIFSPDLGFASASNTTLNDISRVDIRQNGIKGRINWQFNEGWSCAVQATYDEYDDVNSNIYDGSVLSGMASLSKTF